jgi:hypothetical protein
MLLIYVVIIMANQLVYPLITSFNQPPFSLVR